MRLTGQVTIAITRVEDIVEARHKGRDMARELGFSATQSTLIATIISELARNIILYAVEGKVTLGKIEDEDKSGITVTARDNGPGISNVQRALMSGYSSSGGLGLGLPGVRKIADEFEIENHPGRGTVVRTIMWLR
jgi:serine/threonine-protein kinase RsbT